MAYYLVKAELKQSLKTELQDYLRQNSFEALRPFGRAVTFSLKNARVDRSGFVLWEEEDYCQPPLLEEKIQVLDRYFHLIEVCRVNKGDGWDNIKLLPRLFPDLN